MCCLDAWNKNGEKKDQKQTDDFEGKKKTILRESEREKKKKQKSTILRRKGNK